MKAKTKRLTLSELELTPEYQRLTPKQRLFVATYCEGGLVDGNYDPVAATLASYQCKNPETARIMSYSMMQNTRIIAVLNRHFGTQPVDAFLAVLDRAIQNKKLSHAQFLALQLKAEIMGFAKVRAAALHDLPKEVRDAMKLVRKEKRKTKVKDPAKEPPLPTPSKDNPFESY